MEVTVGYGRKLRPDNFSYEHENVEASIFFKSQVSGEIGQLTDEQIALIEQQAQRLFAVAKIRVLSELGVSYQQADDGTIQEYHEAVADVMAAFPGSVATPVPASASIPQPAPQPAPVVPQPAPFPASQPVPVALPPSAPPAVQLPPPPPAPAARGAGELTPEKAALLQELMTNPSAFYDNRAENNGDPKKPLFRHKTKVDARGYRLGLWQSDFDKAGIQI